MTWSTRQQQLLAAMGYSVHRQRGAETAVQASPAPAVSMEGDKGGQAPEVAPHRLQDALRRAAAGHDIASLSLPPLEQLRRDPAAKRALWPQLRALRRRNTKGQYPSEH